MQPFFAAASVSNSLITCSNAATSSGSDASRLATFSRAVGERLRDLVVLDRLGQEALLDGVFLDVLLDRLAARLRAL